MAGLAACKNVISKSQYLKGLQCPKSLWLYRHRKDIARQFSKETELRLAVGHNIGEVAKQYFLQRGVAVEVRAPFWNVEESSRQTRNFLAEAEDVIFEATAMASNEQAYSRIDVLRRSNYGQVDLIEVKAATRVKAYHIEDMAFQYHVFASAGYSIRACYMMLVDTSYVRQGELELDKLFQFCDISSEVLARQRKVLEASSQFSRMLEDREEPLQEMGSHCHRPFSCEYLEYCRGLAARKEQGSLFGAVSQESCRSSEAIWFAPSGQKAADPGIPDDYQICPEQLQHWLEQLRYPLFFLDYECFQSAVPLFDQSRPYQMIPFQFSLHIQRAKDAEPEHLSFLHMNQSDPREPFLRALLAACEQEGSIVIYNQSFEASVNKSLAQDFPSCREALMQLNHRMWDMYLPFQKHWLYHPEQKGAAALKAVLPAFTSSSYQYLAIDNGLDAMNAYLGFMLDTYSPEQTVGLRNALEQYCRQDTLAMSLLLSAMQQELQRELQRELQAASQRSRSAGKEGETQPTDPDFPLNKLPVSSKP